MPRQISNRPMCRWILMPAASGRPALYCCEPVTYYYVEGEDGIKRRVYETFCLPHLIKAKQQEDEEVPDA